MASLVPAQNYDHILDVKSGSNGMHDLQYKAEFAAGQTFVRGSVVTLNSAGKFIAGATTDHDMPMWAINAVADFDVEGDVGNVAGGTVAAFVATGGYEIFTTEFVSTTYAPNDLLTPATSGNAGKVTKASAQYSDALVCGVVSRGTGTTLYDKSVLYFWPVFIPAVQTAIGSV
jgi:hypothetical protein